ncbi:EthD family reductase [Pseudomonas sp. S2_H10]|jgi:uncharacterized protein (TIGR02118 family)
MSLCLFLSVTTNHGVAGVDPVQLERLLSEVSGVVRRAIHVPTPLIGGDPFLSADEAPQCVIQLYFTKLDALESAMCADGPLASVINAAASAGCRWTQQAMLVRKFVVPHASPVDPGSLARATYLVAYEGKAEDDEVWLAHYLRQHPPLMVKLPGIREVEVYTRIDYCSDLLAERVRTLQRNKVVFDSIAALSDALASPLREELRKDFLSLPPFTGASPHYPMQTLEQYLPG